MSFIFPKSAQKGLECNTIFTEKLGVMSIWKEMWVLLRKDFLLEMRNSYSISGTLLYIFSMIFIVYFSFINVEASVWNALFWIIVLFISLSAVSNSFQQESSRQAIYYYSLAHPIAIILAKMAYNIVVLLIMVMLAWGAFSFVTISPVEDVAKFFLALFLASVGFSITFTFISAISIKASGSSTLMAILSFPLVIPMITTLLRFTKQSLGGIENTQLAKLNDAIDVLTKSGLTWSETSRANIDAFQANLSRMAAFTQSGETGISDFAILIGIDLLLIGLAILLFPFIWKE